MKYPESMYLKADYFGADQDGQMEHEHIKLVRVRKEHKCVGYGKNCQKTILKGEYALNESAVFPHEGGWKSCYVCLPCIEEWLEETVAQLEPCPFCGGKAEIQSNDFGFPHWVYCTNCGAKVHGGLQESEEASVMASINAWNRRTR